MAKQHLVLGLILGGCLAAVACSSDSDDNANNTGGTSGSGGSLAGGGASAGTHPGGGSGAGTHPGGSAGAAEAGAPAGGSGTGAAAGASEGGEGGEPVVSEAGAGGEAGAQVVVVPPPPLNPHFVLVPSAPVTPGHALVAGTDYATTEVTSITLQPAAIGNTHVYPDGDSVAASSAGIGFVIERTNDVVNQLDNGAVKTTFDLHDVGTATGPLLDNKAYVGLYGKSAISILDLAANKVSRQISLSELNDPSDSDGSVEIAAGAYDPTKKIAYFLLQRIDRNTIVGPDYTLPCSPTKALVVGMDATTDTIVDINGAGEGNALELSLAEPVTFAISADGKTLTMLADGCYDGGTLTRQGVEILDLQQRTSNVAYTATGTVTLSDLVLLGGNKALLYTSDFSDFTNHWYKLDLGSGIRGDEITGVPAGAVFDGTDLIGVSVTGKVGSLVRYAVGSGAVTPITATTWSGQYDTVTNVALVK